MTGPWDRPKSEPPKASQRTVVWTAAAAIAAVAALGLYWHFVRERHSGAAMAILEGEARSGLPVDAKPGRSDPDLDESERLAGRLWARRHAISDMANCPRYSLSFRMGCADYLADR